MRSISLLLLVAFPITVAAQRKNNDDAFPREKPAVGQPLPELTVYDPQSKEVATTGFRGHYTVFTFGCLT
jgi:cytochrome oxidase Cu insertion factor (SCO1/SenC/PrrC family)